MVNLHSDSSVDKIEKYRPSLLEKEINKKVEFNQRNFTRDQRLSVQPAGKQNAQNNSQIISNQITIQPTLETPQRSSSVANIQRMPTREKEAPKDLQLK